MKTLAVQRTIPTRDIRSFHSFPAIMDDIKREMFVELMSKFYEELRNYKSSFNFNLTWTSTRVNRGYEDAFVYTLSADIREIISVSDKMADEFMRHPLIIKPRLRDVVNEWKKKVFKMFKRNKP